MLFRVSRTLLTAWDFCRQPSAHEGKEFLTHAFSQKKAISLYIESSNWLQAKKKKKKIARELDSLNVLQGLLESSGGRVVLTHLSAWAEEAVSTCWASCSSCSADRGQDGQALQWQEGHAVLSVELQVAERLNHQGAAGALPLSTATETDE